MKKILLLTLLIAPMITSGQIQKLKAIAYSYSYKMKTGYWSDWSEDRSTSIFVMVDSENDMITIHTEYKQVYNIITYEDTYINKEGYTCLPMYCVNDNNKTCRLVLVAIDGLNGYGLLFVIYNDLKVCYTLKGTK